MRERLHEAAKANGRSLNAELNARLRASFETAPEPAPKFPPETLKLFEEVLKNFHGAMMTRTVQRPLLPDGPTALESGEPIRPPVKRRRAR